MWSKVGSGQRPLDHMTPPHSEQWYAITVHRTPEHRGQDLETTSGPQSATRWQGSCLLQAPLPAFWTCSGLGPVFRLLSLHSMC